MKIIAILFGFLVLWMWTIDAGGQKPLLEVIMDIEFESFEWIEKDGKTIMRFHNAKLENVKITDLDCAGKVAIFDADGNLTCGDGDAFMPDLNCNECWEETFKITPVNQ